MLEEQDSSPKQDIQILRTCDSSAGQWHISSSTCSITLVTRGKDQFRASDHGRSQSGSSELILVISICPVVSVSPGLAPFLNAMFPVATASPRSPIPPVVITSEYAALRKDIKNRDTINGSRLTIVDEKRGHHP